MSWGFPWSSPYGGTSRSSPTAAEVRRGHGVARSLQPTAGESTGATGATGDTVGMVIPERNTYLTEAVQAAREAAEKAGLRLALHIAADEHDAERTAVRSALDAGARGLLLSPHWRTAAEAADADHSWLRALDVPVVLLERRPERGSSLYGLDCVRSDHAYGVHLALGHLASLGHRRIVLAARDDSPTARVLSGRSSPSRRRPGASARAARTSSARAPRGRTRAPPIRGRSTWPRRCPDAGPRRRRSTATWTRWCWSSGGLEAAGIDVPVTCSVVAYNHVVADMGPDPADGRRPAQGGARPDRRRAAAPTARHGAGRAGAGAARHLELLPDLVVRDRRTAPPGGLNPDRRGETRSTYANARFMLRVSSVRSIDVFFAWRHQDAPDSTANSGRVPARRHNTRRTPGTGRRATAGTTALLHTACLLLTGAAAAAEPTSQDGRSTSPSGPRCAAARRWSTRSTAPTTASRSTSSRSPPGARAATPSSATPPARATPPTSPPSSTRRCPGSPSTASPATSPTWSTTGCGPSCCRRRSA